MGWLRCDDDRAAGHEGYVVGLVKITRKNTGRSYWRELGFFQGDDEQIPRVERIQVGCECGWRSQVFHAPLRTAWYPCMVSLHDEAVEDACRELWGRHVDHDVLQQNGTVSLRLHPVSG